MGDLTQLNTIKDELGITDATEDTYLERLIKVASDFVRSYCERTFEETEVTENIKGSGTDKIRTSNYPIVSISEVKIDDKIIDEDLEEGYYVDKKAGILEKFTYWTQQINSFHQGAILDKNTDNKLRNVEITYTYGYKLPGEVGRNFPHDLELAVINIIKSMYDKKGQATNIKKESLMDYSVTYITGSIHDPLTMNILDKYKGAGI